MNILYMGKYQLRFKEVTDQLSKYKSVTELCFGDTFIAKYCRENNISWTGYDINTQFVEEAKKLDYNVFCLDILKTDELQKADVCVIIGSLYHFHNSIESFFEKMFSIADKIVISEPIKNLSSGSSFISNFAKKYSNAGNGPENFRYNKHSLIKDLEGLSKTFNFRYEIIKMNKDILSTIRKNERN